MSIEEYAEDYVGIDFYDEGEISQLMVSIIYGCYIIRLEDFNSPNKSLKFYDIFKDIPEVKDFSEEKLKDFIYFTMCMYFDLLNPSLNEISIDFNKIEGIEDIKNQYDLTENDLKVMEIMINKYHNVLLEHFEQYNIIDINLV